MIDDRTEEEIERDYTQDIADDCKMEKNFFARIESRSLINEIIYTGWGKDFKWRE